MILLASYNSSCFKNSKIGIVLMHSLSLLHYKKPPQPLSSSILTFLKNLHIMIIHFQLEGMRLDLVEKNIKVSQINPGLVNTEFSKVRFKNDLEKAKNVYTGMEPLCADDIADVISFLIERPDNVNISDITILPKSQASSVVVNRKTNI